MNIDFCETGTLFLKRDFCRLSASECVRAGSAVGRAVHGRRVGVGFAEDGRSKADAMAVMAGLSEAGAAVWNFGNVFESQLSFFVPFASLGAGIFVDGARKTVRLFGENGLTVSEAVRKRVDEYSVADAPDCSECGKIFDMSALEMLYRDELIKQAPYGITARCKVLSTNETVQALLRDCLPQGEDDTEPVLRVNRFGTSLSAYSKHTGVVPFVKLIAICGMYELENGRDISVPFDAPQFLDELAKTFGRTAYRYLTAPSDGSDSVARRLAAKQFWSRDALFTAVKLMSIMSEYETDLSELYSRLPNFYVSRTVIDLDVPIDFISGFEGEGFSVGRDSGNGVVIAGERGRAHLSEIGDGKYCMTAQSRDMETARELCTDIQCFLEKCKKCKPAEAARLT